MRQSKVEQKIMDQMFMYASGSLEQFRLEDNEVLELVESPEYNDFSPEFRAWLDSQFDSICTCQGQ